MSFPIARSAGISYQQLIAADAIPPPHALTLQNPLTAQLTTVPVQRYTSQAFHDLEMRHLWPKVWQMACREEEIPNAGDYLVYEIGAYSILVLRSQSGLRAYHNVCRHRGRKLCSDHGHAPSIICPFHGFSWNLDGSVRTITSEWDFPHLDRDDFSLMPVQCSAWGGWVFINMDPHAAPLADYLGNLPAQFAVWSPEQRYVQAHVAKVMSCNWKVCQEAFMEAFHVINTHPQILVGTGDENSQYDAWGNFSRAITPNATPSPHLRFAPSEQELFDSVTMRYLDQPPLAAVTPGTTARSMLAVRSRAALRPLVGEAAPLSDACLLDSIYYTLFPNFHPWGGYSRITYRFRPFGNDCRKSVMECYFMSPFSGERPTPAAIHWLSEDQPWTDAPELGLLAKVFNQDTLNLPKVQQGLEASPYESVVLARYQESKIRHFHQLLNAYVNDSQK